MELLTINSAESTLNKIKNAKRIVVENYNSTNMGANTFCAYEFSYDSVHKDQVRHIAIVQLKKVKGVLIYVNQLSIHKFSFFDFFDNESWVKKRYTVGSNVTSHCRFSGSFLGKLSSIRPRDNNVLLLRLKTTNDFRALLSWYIGLCYTQYEIHKILLNNYDIFPKARYELSCPKLIDKSDLTRKKILKYYLSVFDIKDKHDRHRKTIAKIIGNELEKYFFENEESNCFKVFSLFNFLSLAKNGWYELMLSDVDFPSMSNNPTATEFDGFQDQESIHTNDKKRLNDAILRHYYQELMQSVLIERPELSQLLLSKNECVTNFDQQLARFDDYLQKLFNLCWERWSSDHNRDNSSALDQTYSDVQKYFDEHLKRFSAQFDLIKKDNLMLTLIKHSSLNRAKQDYDFFLEMYPGLSNEIPDRIYLMKLVNSPSEIINILQGMFDIKEHEIPDDLLECATIVIEMYVRFYNLEATRIERDKFKSKMFRYPYIGASAALLMNEYIKNNKFQSRTAVKKEHIIRIRGGNNNGINVYDWLSTINESIVKEENRLSAFLYCMPDSLYKFLTARHDLVVAIMEDHRPVQVVVNDALELKKRRTDVRKEAIEKLKPYSIEYINGFIEYFIDTFNTFERFVNIPGFSNLWRNP